jgi:hypothetical protein
VDAPRVIESVFNLKFLSEGFHSEGIREASTLSDLSNIIKRIGCFVLIDYANEIPFTRRRQDPLYLCKSIHHWSKGIASPFIRVSRKNDKLPQRATPERKQYEKFCTKSILH